MRIWDLTLTRYRTLVQIGVFFTALAAGSYAGIYFFTAPAVISPAAGIGLAGLLLLGRSYWPIIFLAIYATHLVSGTPFLLTIFLALGQTVQAVVGVYILQQFDFDTKFARLRDALVFIVNAFAIGSIVPAFGYAAIALQDIELTTFTWSHWWTGTVLSILSITPLIVRWALKPQSRSLFTLVETAISLTIVAGLIAFIMWSDTTSVFNISFVYVLLVPLAWIALRLGPRMTITALFLVSIITLGGTYLYFDDGSADVPLGVELFQSELFLIILTVIFLILVSLEEERKEITKQLESYNAELRDALAQLSEYDQAKNNFLAVLAHELRNPLATIVTHFELLKLQHLAEISDTDESVTIIERRFQNIQRLLDDLLDVSRISQNKIALRMRNINMTDVVRVAVQNASYAVQESQQSLTMHLPHERIIVEGDATRLEQVCTNLLLNASKFTPEHGNIAITATRDNDTATVTVTDTGIGINAEKFEKIFDVFYQDKTSITSQQTGLGIGLALTRDLVIMHGGTIRAESAGVGQGSTFTVTLPLAVSTSEDGDADTPSDVRLFTPRMHILIVDDNRSVADGMAKLLTLSGFTTATAQTGTEAIGAMANDPRPDAIFLDIALPDMSGFDVARKLRNECKFTGPIAAVSGYGQEEDKQQAFDAGCTHHLTKPVRLADLLEVLR